MPTTLTNGIQLPDKGSVDWYSSMQSNYNLIDTHLGDTDIHVTAEDKANWDSKQGSLSQDQIEAIAQVATNTNDIATLQSDKANASHTHSSSDITDIDDYATKQYVDNSISGLVDNAPDALNTLNELSAALNDDSNFATTVTNALSNKANSADLATVATSGSYDDLTDKPSIPTNTSDLNNDSGYITGMYIAAYGKSTYADVLAAYQANKVVYCRASSSSNPASGNQLRMAFLAYVNNEATPTEFEFQYYRSLSSHTYNDQSDQVFVYKLNKTNGWSVTIRQATTKIIPSIGLNYTFAAGNSPTNTIKVKLNSETSLGTIGTTEGLYPVGVDSNGQLCVLISNE